MSTAKRYESRSLRFDRIRDIDREAMRIMESRGIPFAAAWKMALDAKTDATGLGSLPDRSEGPDPTQRPE